MEHATSDRSHRPRELTLRGIQKELKEQHRRLGRRVERLGHVADPAERKREADKLRAENESLNRSRKTVKKALKRES